jgi:hypothetical protein
MRQFRKNAMPKLFLVYLGGGAPKSNIELHDGQFVAGETIEDTFEQLRQRWFGTVKGLHLDTYLEIRPFNRLCRIGSAAGSSAKAVKRGRRTSHGHRDRITGLTIQYTTPSHASESTATVTQPSGYRDTRIGPRPSAYSSVGR